ncbi:hypothetical protein GQ600_24399 [Phytophthora cactorum]|nr:hypothetical protein GQ600_24399 [Phytophthora cactorum]
MFVVHLLHKLEILPLAKGFVNLWMHGSHEGTAEAANGRKRKCNQKTNEKNSSTKVVKVVGGFQPGESSKPRAGA